MYSPWLLLCILSGHALFECPPTSFEHFYEIRNEDNSTRLIRHRNYFPLMPINDFAMLKDLCVDESGLPVVRRCLETSQWEELDKNVTCQLDQDGSSQLSTSLNRLQLIEGLNIVENISHIISQANQQLQPVDVLIVNKMIHELAKQPKSVAACTDLIGIYSNLMATNRSVLQISSRLNATNNLLNDFDDYTNKLAPQFDNCNPPQVVAMSKDLVDVQVHDGVQVLIGYNLSIFYMYPDCSKYTGIAIYSEPAPQRAGCRQHRFWYRFLLANQSVESLKAEPGLQAATFITDHLWQSLRRAGVTHLVFKIYANSALFVDTSAAGSAKPTPASHVLSINIPQASKKLPHPLVFLLRNTDFDKPETWMGCGYWDNKTWKTTGIRTSWNSLLNDPVVVCYTNHLTRFTFLVGATCVQHHCPYKVDPDDPLRHVPMLDRTTNVGCGLSLFGLLGIWLTAAVSDRWRSMESTKLPLNISVAMSLLYFLMLLSYINESVLRFSFAEHSIECIAIGALFQYSVLLLFSWMLFFGIRQYRLFVAVYVVTSPQDVLRTTVIAWSLPLLPTLLVALFSSASYSPVQSGDINALCYPSGPGLIYGVLLPIGLVLSANLVMFVCIFYSVCRMNDQDGRLIWLQLRLFILLFSLLGLTWIFAICCYFRFGLVVAFLFCLTATIQGFVLFLYCVVFNKVARFAWLKLFFGNQHFVRSQLN